MQKFERPKELKVPSKPTKVELISQGEYIPVFNLTFSFNSNKQDNNMTYTNR